MKKLLTSVLLFALLVSLCACGKDVREEESGGEALQTYRLPTEWTVTDDARSRVFTVSYEGSTATLTTEGEVILTVTLDEAGNAVYRKEADGSELTAVYGADGKLAETLLRSEGGAVKQRTVYDEHGRAVKEYTQGRYGEASLREFTYGEDGELLTEARYGSYGYHTYEYHANGERAADTVYMLDFLPYCREEFDENGNQTWKSYYDEDGNVSFRYEYDAEGNIKAKYDKDGSLYVDEREETVYDENGNLTEYKYYNDDGTLYERYEYDYDENGNEIAWRHYYIDGTLTREVFRTYDETGILTKTVQKDYRDSGELIDSFEIEYDEAGNQTLYTAYDAEGNLSSRSEMKHEFIGGKWVLTRYTSYDGDGSLLFRQEMTHDERGNETASLTYDADGTLSTRTEMTYDERGNLTESANYDADGKVFHREVTVYDEQNNPLEQTVYNGEEITSHIVCENRYEYDDAGRLVGESRAAVEGRYTYTYKEGSGLWTETCTDGDGNVVHTYETVYDGSGNPKIEQRTAGERERRFEYEWSEAGELLSRVWYYGADKEVITRMKTEGHVEQELTEAQYRRMLTLLLDTIDTWRKP